MINEILNYWINSFYLHPLVLVCCVYVLSKLKEDKTANGNIFRIYVISIFILFISGDLFFSIIPLQYETAHVIIEILNNSVTAIETAVFSYYFRAIIKAELFRRILNFSVYLIILSAFIVNVLAPFNDSIHLLRIIGFYFDAGHFYFLVLPCVFYLLELYKNNEVLDSRNALITLALLCYSLISTPYLVLFEHLYYFYRNIFIVLTAIHYILLMLLCLSLTVKPGFTKPIHLYAEN